MTEISKPSAASSAAPISSPVCSSNLSPSNSLENSESPGSRLLSGAKAAANAPQSPQDKKLQPDVTSETNIAEAGSTNLQSASQAKQQSPPASELPSVSPAHLAVGRMVDVASRTWPGINKPGGVATILAVHTEVISLQSKASHSNELERPELQSQAMEVTHVDVKYVLGGRDKRIPVEFVEHAPEYETFRRFNHNHESCSKSKQEKRKTPKKEKKDKKAKKPKKKKVGCSAILDEVSSPSSHLNENNPIGDGSCSLQPLKAYIGSCDGNTSMVNPNEESIDSSHGGTNLPSSTIVDAKPNLESPKCHPKMKLKRRWKKQYNACTSKSDTPPNEIGELGYREINSLSLSTLNESKAAVGDELTAQDDECGKNSFYEHEVTWNEKSLHSPFESDVKKPVNASQKSLDESACTSKNSSLKGDFPLKEFRLRFGQLPQLFDDMSLTLEKRSIPRARYQLKVLKGRLKLAVRNVMEQQVNIGCKKGNQEEDKRVFELQSILEISKTLHNHIGQDLIKCGIYQCNQIMKCLNNPEKYRNDCDILTDEEREQCRPFATALRDLRSYELNDQVDDIDRKLTSLQKEVKEWIAAAIGNPDTDKDICTSSTQLRNTPAVDNPALYQLHHRKRKYEGRNERSLVESKQLKKEIS